MPIHDQGYRRYRGDRARTGAGWIVIARAGIRTFVAKRQLLALLLVSWVPFVGRAAQIYFAANVPQARDLLAVKAETFRQFLDQQEFFVFFVTVYVGAGLIANDRRANALQIYLSKPLTRAEYVFGKLAVLVSFLLLVTWVPAMLLLLVQIAFAGNFTFLMNNAFLFPAITVLSVVEVLLAASTMLALSSLSKSSRYVGVLYTAVIFFSAAIYRVVYAVTRSSALSWLSPGASVEQIGNVIFRLKAPYDDTVAGVAVCHRRADRAVGAGARAPRARHRGGRLVAAVTTGLVVADHLSKWYGQVIGLNDVSVTVPTGITGLLGPNGAGKSTFMKLMTGQLKPSKGSITVLGEPIWQNPGIYRRIGFCPEQDAFYDRMTGLEWVTALVRLNGGTEAEATAMARRSLEMVDLLDAADKKIGAYSKGMRQRVKMAQALAHDPELLILDEPLSGMDPIARRKTIRMIKDWGRAGKSVIVSSHILHEIESMTSNILLINQGRILAEGNVHQIRDLIDEHPHTVYIKAERTRELAREFLTQDDLLSLRFEDEAVVVQTARPDVFYARLTELAASGELGTIHEVTSPDDNLQAVFQYLVKS